MLRTDANIVVDAYITCKKANLPINIDELELLWLSDPEKFLDNVKSIIAENRHDPPNQTVQETGTVPSDE